MITRRGSQEGDEAQPTPPPTSAAPDVDMESPPAAQDRPQGDPAPETEASEPASPRSQTEAQDQAWYLHLHPVNTRRVFTRIYV